MGDGQEGTSGEQTAAALARIAALEKLLACYRSGRSPSEKLHRELARTRTRMDDLFPQHPSQSASSSSSGGVGRETDG